MRVRGLVVCAVVAIAAVGIARSCATEPNTEPLGDDAPAPVAPVSDDVSSSIERVRTHVRPPAASDVGGTEVAAAEPVPAPLVDGDVPEEHRGVGDESVALFLVDAETGDGISSRVRLWRLGVPADDRWPAGDHIQKEFRLAISELVTDLPPGRYRLEVFAAAPGTEDPPEFVVRAGQENEFRARIELPPEIPMGLRVRDENGVLLAEAHGGHGGTGTHWGRAADAPEWAHPRTLRDRSSKRFGGHGGGRRTLSSRWDKPVEAEHGVFDLGTIRRSGRNFGWSRGFRFRFQDRTDVRVRTNSRDADEGRTYVAVSVPPQPLIDCVRLPDGTRAIDAGADVEIACEAVAAAPGDHGAWRTVPVRVTVELASHEEFEFTWCIDDGTPQQRTLTPVAAAVR